MLIKFEKLGITSDDIKKEEDVEKLKTYKIELDFSIGDIRHQLDNYKNDFINKGISGDYEWLKRAKRSAQLYGLLSQIIQQRISFVRKNKNKGKAETFSNMFVDNARKSLNKETFDSIFDKTMFDISALNH